MLRFGLIYLALTVAGDLGQRQLGAFGLYAVSFLGGLVSSASATATVAALASQGKNTPFQGLELTGRVVRTLVGGRTVHAA